jgi:hypothetical protein
MLWTARLIALSVMLLHAAPALAEPDQLTFGGDTFVGGSRSFGPVAAERDLFASGGSVTLQGRIAQDTHVTGFTVDVEAETVGSVYAAGASVTLRAAIGQDLSAMGFTVRTSPTATVQGNARLAGGTVTIDGPVKGALIAAGGEVILNAPVDGDVWLVGQDVSFGPSAKIAGSLRYSAPEAISIPTSVIAADRVTFEEIDRTEMMEDMREEWQDRDFGVMPTFMSLFVAFLLTLVFFVVLGAIFLAFLPHKVEELRRSAQSRAGSAVLSGVIGLSVLFGLVPISAMTLFGIPLVPFVILALIVLWTLGYMLGAYVVAMRVLHAFGGLAEPTIFVRLFALALGVTVIAVLNFIPVIGWLVNFLVVLLGIGAIAQALFGRMTISPVNPPAHVEAKPNDDIPNAPGVQ